MTGDSWCARNPMRLLDDVLDFSRLEQALASAAARCGLVAVTAPDLVRLVLLSTLDRWPAPPTPIGGILADQPSSTVRP